MISVEYEDVQRWNLNENVDVILNNMNEPCPY